MAVMTRNELQAVVDRYYDMWPRRDAHAFAEFYTPDGVVESPMFATLKGRKAIEDGHQAFFTSFPDATNTVEAVLIDPPHIATFSTIMGTHVNEFYGLPGTNRRMVIRHSRLLKMDGDLIAHERRIYDFTGLLVQVGVLKAKPARALDD